MENDKTETHGRIGYHAIRLRSWNLAKKLAVDALPLLSRCFRGQSNACWRLRTTLEREAERRGCPTESLNDRERGILHEFRRRGHLHGDSSPSDLVEWSALIQHHGGPTRFLDFTYSFYVACFFAVEDAIGDAAVWVADLSAMRRAFARKESACDLHRPRVFNAYSRMRCIDAVNCGCNDHAVVSVEPNQTNERLAAQQGLFLAPLSVSISFEESLKSALDLPQDCFEREQIHEYGDGDGIPFKTIFHPLLKIVLPRETHSHARRELRLMNITSASLFPGLDGFARSLRWYLTP